MVLLITHGNELPLPTANGKRMSGALLTNYTTARTVVAFFCKQSHLQFNAFSNLKWKCLIHDLLPALTRFGFRGHTVFNPSLDQQNFEVTLCSILRSTNRATGWAVEAPSSHRPYASHGQRRPHALRPPKHLTFGADFWVGAINVEKPHSGWPKWPNTVPSCLPHYPLWS
jgi:hypothetical protein